MLIHQRTPYCHPLGNILRCGNTGGQFWKPIDKTFPLDMLESRLKCPVCGCRPVQVVFEPPAAPAERRAS